MSSLAADATTLVDHFHHLQSDEARATLLGLTIGLTGLGFRPIPRTFEGSKRDVHFATGNERPLSFIVNRDDLLFYLRPAALRSNPELKSQAERVFETVSVNNAGETTIRLRTPEEAARLVDWISGCGLI